MTDKVGFSECRLLLPHPSRKGPFFASFYLVVSFPSPTPSWVYISLSNCFMADPMVYLGFYFFIISLDCFFFFFWLYANFLTVATHKLSPLAMVSGGCLQR